MTGPDILHPEVKPRLLTVSWQQMLSSILGCTRRKQALEEGGRFLCSSSALLRQHQAGRAAPVPELLWNTQNAEQLEQQVLSGGPVVLQGAMNKWSLPYSNIHALEHKLGDREVRGSSSEHFQRQTARLCQQWQLPFCETRLALSDKRQSQVPVEVAKGGADYRDALREKPFPGKEFQVLFCILQKLDHCGRLEPPWRKLPF